jgi:protocatechuate 3,4-dioxygenase beta subunit
MPNLLVLVLLFSPQAQLPPKCSLSGIVSDASTGDPLNKVNISLQSLGVQGGRGAPTAVTISDAKGRFEMVDLDPGVYRLSAKRSGYLEMSYGAHRPGAEGSRVRLEAGQSLSDLRIKLTPGAAISGTVRDSDGEPLEGAHVVLARFAYERGIPGVRPDAAVDTDDRGEYRFHGLAAGKYYVSVETGSFGQSRVDHTGSSGPAEMPVPTLYPGVHDLVAAAPIEMSDGRKVDGIDVTLTRSPVYRVRGRVANPPPRSIMLELRDVKNAGVRERPLRISTKNESGDFEFRGVPPGSYSLTTVAGPLNCSTPIIVTGADVDDVKVTLTPGATIERLTLSTAGDEKLSASDLAVQLVSNANTYYFYSSSGVGDVRPDRYNIYRFYGSAVGQYYPKSARAGETDLLADGLTVPAGASIHIAVTLASDGAAVEGAVRNEDGLPASGATVVLVPKGRSLTYLFKSTTSDQNGHYLFSAIAPGDYKVFAWDDVEPEIWDDPDFLQKYEKLGQETTLETKDRKTIDVRLITQAAPN